MIKTLFCALALGSAACLANAQTLNVASYNVRYNNPEDTVAGNGWKQRCPVVSSIIRFHDFDIFGAQEVTNPQLKDLLKNLSQYNYIGVGRDDGKTEGEYAAIFYRTDLFTCLENGHFWLSEDTTKSNLGWDAVCIRICTWGKFEDKRTHRRFWFFNAHTDHVGVIAQRESSKLILRKIKEMCGTDPVILTGDFNVDQNSECYAVLHDSNILKDTYDKAELRYAENGTFVDWDPNTYTPSRIDHIFVSKDFEVKKYGILTDTYRAKNKQTGNYEAHTPSDHFPVKAVLTFDAPEKK